jgi:hypothetical protein
MEIRKQKAEIEATMKQVSVPDPDGFQLFFIKAGDTN